MAEHKCIHEADIATLINSNKTVAIDVKETKETCQNIYKILNGNGSSGLVTKVAVLQNDAKKQPSLKLVMLYGSIGGGLTVILGLGLKALAGG